MTSDNGYFLYYDKSVFTEEDLATLDGILAAANAAGKQVHMDVSNGWYLASFFLGNGCTLTIEDGTGFLPSMLFQCRAAGKKTWMILANHPRNGFETMLSGILSDRHYCRPCS